MNLDLDVREIQAQVERLRDMPQLMRYPLATALTRTAVQVKAAQQAEMRDSFDRPTPYTLGAIFMTPATAASMVATVGVKDQASGGRAPLAWLRWQIYGGLRRLTGFEKALINSCFIFESSMRSCGRFGPATLGPTVERSSARSVEYSISPFCGMPQRPCAL